MITKDEYWDAFYKESEARLKIPSQFSAFVASEFINKVDTIIDIGCGNGRDSIFFARLGFTVLGVDQSLEAIQSANKLSLESMSFIKSTILDDNLAIYIKDAIHNESRKLVYSRFFLHAINDVEEEKLWSLLNIILSKGDFLAIEFRTDRDESLRKSTASHYRRFIRPFDLLRRAEAHGFECEYLIEGFGLAKYKNDDAYVARVIFTLQ